MAAVFSPLQIRESKSSLSRLPLRSDNSPLPEDLFSTKTDFAPFVIPAEFSLFVFLSGIARVPSSAHFPSDSTKAFFFSRDRPFLAEALSSFFPEA